MMTVSAKRAKPTRTDLRMCVAERFELVRGDAADARVAVDVLVHDGAGIDDGTLADRHAGQNDGTRADPRAIADRHGFQNQRTCAMRRRIELVRARENHDARLDRHPVTDRQALEQIENALAADDRVAPDGEP